MNKNSNVPENKDVLRVWRWKGDNEYIRYKSVANEAFQKSIEIEPGELVLTKDSGPIKIGNDQIDVQNKREFIQKLEPVGTVNNELEYAQMVQEYLWQKYFPNEERVVHDSNPEPGVTDYGYFKIRKIE